MSAKGAFKKVIKDVVGEKTILFLLRTRTSILMYLKNAHYTIAIKRYYSYLKILKTFRKQHLNPRQKPHILFVTEKWCSCDPAMGPTNSEHNLFGSLESTGLATYERFHFDEYHLKKRRPCDFALLRLCIESKPDLLVFTSCDYCPRWMTLGVISQKIGIPVVALWWDDIGDLAESALPFVDLNIVFHLLAVQRTHHPEKYLLMWVPQDPRVYYNPNKDRDIDISFVGAINKTPDRRTGVEALRANGIKVYQAGGQRENPLSLEDYAGTYMRSKITLNFGIGWAGTQQAKSRVFEATLCGAMLLGSENTDTNTWFEPMVDYVPFTDEADLVKKAQYYLEHDALRKQIAETGYYKAKDKYNAELFWNTVFGRILRQSYR
jgi:hypothetical protein